LGPASSRERQARRQGQPRRSKLDPHRDYLRERVAQTPDPTISELPLAAERDVRASRRRSGRFSTAAGWRSKKTAHASEQDRPDILKRRRDWFDRQPDVDPHRLVFIDETWLSTTMARRHGLSRSGRPARTRPPATLSSWTISALTRVLACVPPSRRPVATLFYLPPYSPNFNFENAFSKLKAPLRKPADRTRDTLWHRIGAIIPAVEPAERANLSRTSGYDPD
jgi:transposase